jgi:hypothetical protein
MYEWRELVELYKLTMAPPSNLQRRYNICPTTGTHRRVDRRYS